MNEVDETYEAYMANVGYDNLAMKSHNHESITCPFCNENDFDKIGLKYHLIHYCKVFYNTEDIGVKE